MHEIILVLPSYYQLWLMRMLAFVGEKCCSRTLYENFTTDANLRASSNDIIEITNNYTVINKASNSKIFSTGDFKNLKCVCEP
jgi:hypothetical protein